MLTASDRFLDGLRYSHEVIVRAATLDANGDEKAEFRVKDGTLSVDGRRNIWRQVSVTLVADKPADLVNLDVRDTLKIERGIRFFDQTEEWVTLGLFKIQRVTQQYTGEVVQVEAYDFGSAIEDYRLVAPYAPYDEFSNPLTSVTAIEELVGAAFADRPTITIDSAINTGQYAPAGTVFTGSRWEAIQTLASGLGGVLYANPDGSFRLRYIEDGDPVWEANSGDGGVIVSVSSVRDRADQYNAVPVRWESPEGGGMTFVVDSDPLSPTYWDGPFGRKPLDEQQIATVTNSVEATVAAAGLLQQYKGFARSVSFTALANPLLEPFDVVRVRVGRFDEDHVIDSIQFNLESGTMSCETRLVRSTVPVVTP